MKATRLFTTFSALLLLAACGDDKDGSGNFGAIRVADMHSLTQTVAASATQAQDVNFTTDGAWTSEIFRTRADVPDWITISPDHGDAAGSYTIRIGLQPNTESESREAVVTVRCGSSSFNIRIKQQGNEGDETAERLANGRLLRMTEYRGDAVESVYDFSYDEQGRITEMKMYGDAAMTELWAEYLFTYDGTEEMTCTERFYDKEPEYRLSATYTGRFDGSNAIIKERRNASLDIGSGSRTEIIEIYTYDAGLLTQINTVETHSSGGNEYEVTSQILFSYAERLCTRIDYNPTPSGDNPYQTFDYDDEALAFARDPLFHTQGLPTVNPALCVIAEPDMLRAVGFCSDRSEFVPLPSRVETMFSERIVETFSYRKTIEYLRVGQTADAAEMVVTRSTTGSTSRYVLTFLGI